MSVFQLSVVSQNDPFALDGDSLYCQVKCEGGGEPYKLSFPFGQQAPLPVPPQPCHTALPTPTWWVPFAPNSRVSGLDKVIYTIEITSVNNRYKPLTIVVSSDELAAWVENNHKEETNQIFRAGDQGVFGFAQFNPRAQEPYWIYTITAGVFKPKVHPWVVPYNWWNNASLCE